MNKQMQDFARQMIKDGLAQLPEKWQYMFKRMYFHDNLDANINAIVDSLPEDKLNCAMQQVQNSLTKQV